MSCRCCAVLEREPERSLTLFLTSFGLLIGVALGGLTALAIGLAALL